MLWAEFLSRWRFLYLLCFSFCSVDPLGREGISIHGDPTMWKLLLGVLCKVSHLILITAL